jgi:NTE family protein
MEAIDYMSDDLLESIPLFESLSKDAREFIASRLKTEAFASGEMIVRQGDTGDSLYIIIRGLVKVTRRGKTGASKELARLQTGDYFGEMSLLAGQPRSADITAVTDTTTLVLYKNDMDEILREYPTIAVHFGKVLSKRLRDSDHKLETGHALAIISVYSRHVASLLQTVLSINLAASFSKELRKQVILVDASDNENELANILHLDLPKAADLKRFAHQDILDGADLTPFIRTHNTGIHILSLTGGSKLKQRTFEKDIRPLLEKLKNEYGYLLINCSKNITRLIHSALEHSDLVVYLTPTSDDAIQRCKKDADLFIQGYGDTQNLLIGVLKEEKRSLISWQLLEETLAPHSFLTIHQDQSIIERFLKTGQPFVLETPKQKISRSLQRLTRKIGRVRIGLALGSGAARGFAHVGLLKVLETNDIPIDMITGTSMGAFVGGFFAAGITAVELEEMVLSYRNKRKVRQTIFDITIPLYGLSKGNRLAKFMRNHLGDITFDELYIPFAAVATDISTGKEVILRHGILWKALRASGSVPVMFEPFYLDGRYLIDGGITNPLPTDILIENEVDFVISCSVNSAYSLAKRVNGESPESRYPGSRIEKHVEKSAKKYRIIEALTRTIGIMSATNTLNKARLADIDIRPDVSCIDWTDFHRGEELVRVGEEAAEEAMPAIMELLHGSSH